MEINGLPAHALLVHLVVVLLSLTALAAVVVSLWPAAQRKLTFLVPLGAVIGALAVGVPFVILPALGFEPRGEKTAEGIRALVLIFALAPAVLHLSAAFVLWRFPLGRLRQQELREKLATRFGT